MKPEELLGAIEHLMRTQPPRSTLDHESAANYEWLGQAVALLKQWNSGQGFAASLAVNDIHNSLAIISSGGYNKLMLLIHEAHADLRIKTVGPVNVAVGAGMVFQYFDTVVQLIGGATSEVFFVDAYMNAEFVRRFLPAIKPGVAVRLLTGAEHRYIAELKPAAELFSKENGIAVSIRSTKNVHERWVFLDGISGYQSGASFKDGAANAPATLTQATDTFQVVLETYERIWAGSAAV